MTAQPLEFIDLKTQQARLGDRIPRAIQRVLDLASLKAAQHRICAALRQVL